MCVIFIPILQVKKNIPTLPRTTYLGCDNPGFILKSVDSTAGLLPTAVPPLRFAFLDYTQEFIRIWLILLNIYLTEPPLQQCQLRGQPTLMYTAVRGGPLAGGKDPALSHTQLILTQTHRLTQTPPPRHEYSCSGSPSEAHLPWKHLPWGPLSSIPQPPRAALMLFSWASRAPDSSNSLCSRGKNFIFRRRWENYFEKRRWLSQNRTLLSHRAR